MPFLPIPWHTPEPKQLVKLRVLSGALASVAMAPDILDRWVTITDDSADNVPAIRIVRKDRPQDYVRIVFEQDRSRHAVLFSPWRVFTAQ